MLVVDADGHVAEGPSLAIEAMQRWPQHITPRAVGRALVIEGRNYPEADGPGAGCPREYGLSTADGINYSSAEGVLGDADRDQIDTMMLYPSLGLVGVHIPPALKTRNLDHPDLDPFYSAAVELDMPLGVHGAPGMHLPKVGVDRFTITFRCTASAFRSTK